MRYRLEGDYQLDLGDRGRHPTALFLARGNGNIPPKAPQSGVYVNGGFKGTWWQRSQNVINSLEKIIIGSEWEKLDTIMNTISLVRFLRNCGLRIYAFNFIPEKNENNGEIYWILQVKVNDKESTQYKYRRVLFPYQKQEIKRLVLEKLAQKGVKESDIQIIE